jgi:predicted RNase H-like HicB family nuclease
MLFKIRGISYEITADAIVSAAKGVPPNPPNGMNKYFVALDRGKYPIKQLISLYTGLSRVSFTAQDAHRIVTKLDFEIREFAVAAPFEPQPSMENGEALAFPVTIERDEDDYWLASCPSLPGCHSQGHSRPEAISNIKEAIRGYLASMQSHDEALPDQEWVLVQVSL